VLGGQPVVTVEIETGKFRRPLGRNEAGTVKFCPGGTMADDSPLRVSRSDPPITGIALPLGTVTQYSKTAMITRELRSLFLYKRILSNWHVGIHTQVFCGVALLFRWRCLSLVTLLGGTVKFISKDTASLCLSAAVVSLVMTTSPIVAQNAPKHGASPAAKRLVTLVKPHEREIQMIRFMMTVSPRPLPKAFSDCTLKKATPALVNHFATLYTTI
jgi:hypothetical protein